MKTKRIIGIALLSIIALSVYAIIIYEAFVVKREMTMALFAFYTLGFVSILFGWLFDLPPFDNKAT